MGIDSVSENLYYIGAIGVIMGIGKNDLQQNKVSTKFFVNNNFDIEINKDLYLTCNFRALKDIEEKNILSIRLKDSKDNIIGELKFCDSIPFIPYLNQNREGLFEEGINDHKWRFIKDKFKSLNVSDKDFDNLSVTQKSIIYRTAINSKIEILTELLKQDGKKLSKKPTSI